MSEPMSEHVSCGRPGCNDLDLAGQAVVAWGPYSNFGKGVREALRAAIARAAEAAA